MPIAFFATGAEYSTLVQPWLLQLLRYGAGRLETLGRRNAFVRFIDIGVLFVYLVSDFCCTFFFSLVATALLPLTGEEEDVLENVQYVNIPRSNINRAGFFFLVIWAKLSPKSNQLHFG